MFKGNIILVFCAVIVFICCSCISVNYNGPTYSPTKTVQIYYAKNLIDKPYQVMGKATASTWSSNQNESLRQALVEKAKACGANAILIDSINEKISGPIQIDDDSEIDDGKMAANHPGGSSEDIFMLPMEGVEQTTESVDTSKIVAEFLKFTDKKE